MNIIFLNCCGLRGHNNENNSYCCKLKAILEWVPLSILFLCLQETHTTPEILKHFLLHLEEQGWWYVFAHSTCVSAGVAILVRKSALFKINTVSTDPNRRYVIISVEQNFGKFHIGLFYAPAVRSERIEWFTNTSILILSNAIYGGDWNVTCKDIENSSKNVYYNDITAFDFFCGEHLIENATPSKTAHTFYHSHCWADLLLYMVIYITDLPIMAI